MKKKVAVILVALILLYSYYKEEPVSSGISSVKLSSNPAQISPQFRTIVKKSIAPKITSETGQSFKRSEHISSSSRNIAGRSDSRQVISDSGEPLLSYVLEDGMVVIQGDLILGEVARGESIDESGFVVEPTIEIWPTTEIPYIIQPSLPNPQRIHDALAFFAPTNIRFVPYDNQEDAIVFEQGTQNCKSYLGYIGGHQKIVLSKGCSATEVAHEIMHSLGFVHEQNRTDRDQYVEIIWDNIDQKVRSNFEKFSYAMMKVTALSPFDFESIMIYPDRMFSINKLPTMKSLIEGQAIAPRDGLSDRDLDRINKTY